MRRRAAQAGSDIQGYNRNAKIPEMGPLGMVAGRPFSYFFQGRNQIWAGAII